MTTPQIETQSRIPRKPRVVWTKTELGLLAASVDKLTRLTPGADLSRIVKLAMDDVLPPERHRPFRHASSLGKGCYPSFSAAHQRGLNAARLLAEASAGDNAAALGVRSAESDTTPKTPNSAPAAEAASPEPEPMTVASFGTAEMLVEVLMRLRQDLVDRVEARLDRLETALVAVLAAKAGVSGTSFARPAAAFIPPPSIKQREPIVSIVGLHRDQTEHVRRKVADLGFKVLWVDKDQSRRFFPTTDYIIIQRHCPHHWYDVAQRCVPNNRIAFVDGGITGVVQKIHDFHSQRVAEAARA